MVFSIDAVRKYEFKSALFRAAILFASVPLVALIVYSIKTSIQNLFKQNTSSFTRDGKISQDVSGHVKANGTVVGDYTRTVTGKVPKLLLIQPSELERPL